MGALDSAVRQGKALYAGISSYSAEQTRGGAAILRDLGTPLLIHQPSYSILNRWIEPDLVEALGELGVGCITFSPLAQGVLTDRYLNGIPEGSRASRNDSLAPDTLTEETIAKVQGAERDRRGARPVARPDGARLDAARPADHLDACRREQRRRSSSRISAPSTTSTFSAEELAEIDGYAPESAVNIWAGRATAEALAADDGVPPPRLERPDVSEIALGSWLTFGGGVERERAVACVDRAFELGINFVDTANVYGRGAAEEFLGEVLAQPAARLVRARDEALLPDGRRRPRPVAARRS